MGQANEPEIFGLIKFYYQEILLLTNSLANFLQLSQAYLKVFLGF